MHEVGLIPLFWVGFSKQRKKPNWRISSKLSSKRVFRLSSSGRNEKTPLGWNCTRSVSYHYFGWAFPSSAKSRIDEYRQNLVQNAFFDFPHRGETKKHRWDRNPRGRFHTTILGWLFQEAQKAELTNIVKIEFKTRFSTFPIGTKRKNTVGIELHEVGFIPLFWVGFSKQRKKPNWRISSKFSSKRVFGLSPSGQKEKTPLG